MSAAPVGLTGRPDEGDEVPTLGMAAVPSVRLHVEAFVVVQVSTALVPDGPLVGAIVMVIVGGGAVPTSWTDALPPILC